MDFFNTSYKVKSSYDIMKNEKILNDIYLPIIGKDGLSLYNEFILQSNNIFNSFQNIHNDLMKKYNLTKNEFIEVRKKLEAIGLLNTYYDEFKNEYTYYINSNLAYRDFMNSDKLRAILVKKIGEIELRKLQYKYENNFQDLNQINLTENILYLFDDVDKEKLFKFHFSKLYMDIIKVINIDFQIDFETKEHIEDIYTKHSLEYDEILELCIAAIDYDTKTISILVFDSKLDILLNDKRKQEIQINTKINRKKELFFTNNQIDEYNMIIDDYRKFSSENYLLSLTKQKLNSVKLNFINKLREEFQLEDYQINVIFDFSLFKNNGKFVQQYIETICRDIWQNDVVNIKDIIEKLRISIIGYHKTSNKENKKLEFNDNKNATHSADISSIFKIAGVTDND